METESRNSFKTIFPKYSRILTQDQQRNNDSIEMYIRNQLPHQVEVIKKIQSTFNSFLNQYSNLIVKRPQLVNLSYSLASKATQLLDKHLKQIELKYQKLEKSTINQLFQNLNPRKSRQLFREQLANVQSLVRQKYIQNYNIARESQQQIAHTLYTLFQIYFVCKSDLVSLSSKHLVSATKVAGSAFKNETVEPQQLAANIYLQNGFMEQISNTVSKRCRPFVNKKDFFNQKIKQILKQSESKVESNLIIFLDSLMSKQKHRITKALIPKVQSILKNIDDCQQQKQCQSISEAVERLKRKFMQIKNNSYYLDIIRGNFSDKYKMQLNKIQNLYYLNNLEKYLQTVFDFMDQLLKVEEKIIENRKNFKKFISFKVQSSIQDISNESQANNSQTHQLPTIILEFFEKLKNACYNTQNKKDSEAYNNNYDNIYLNKVKEEQAKQDQLKRDRQERQKQRRQEAQRSNQIRKQKQQEERQRRQQAISDASKKRQQQQETRKRQREQLQKKQQLQRKRKMDLQAQERRKRQQDRKKIQQQRKKRQKQQDQARKRKIQQQKIQRQKKDQQRKIKQEQQRKKQQRIRQENQAKAELQKQKKAEELRKKQQQQLRKKKDLQQKKLKQLEDIRQRQDKKKQQELKAKQQQKRRQQQQRRRQQQQSRKIKQQQQQKRKQEEKKRLQEIRKEQELKKKQLQQQRQKQRKRKQLQEKQRQQKQQKKRQMQELEREKKRKQAEEQQRQRKRKQQEKRKQQQQELKKKKQEQLRKKKQQQLKKKQQQERLKQQQQIRKQEQLRKKQIQQKKKKDEQEKKRKEEQQRKRKQQEEKREKQQAQKKAKLQIEERKKKDEALKAKKNQPPKKSAINYADLDDELIDEDEQVKAPTKPIPAKVKGKQQQDQYVQDYQDDFDDFSPEKQEKGGQQQQGSEMQIQPKKLIDEDNLKCLNQYLKGGSYARKNKPNLENYNNQTQYVYIFEELIQNKKIFIHEASAAKAINDFSIQLQDESINHQDLQLTLETIKQELNLYIQNNTGTTQLDPRAKIIFPFSFANDLNIYLIEITLNEGQINVVMANQLDESHQQKYSSLIEAFLHVLGFEQPAVRNIVVPTQSKSVLDTFDKELPNLLLLFAMHYEQNDYKLDIKINQYTIDRFFYISHVLQPFYKAIEEEPDKLTAFYDKLFQKFSTDPKIGIQCIQVQASNPQYQELVKMSSHKIKEEFMANKNLTHKLVMVQIIIGGEEEEEQVIEKVTCYYSMSKQSPKPVLYYYIISKDDQDQQNLSRMFELSSSEIDDQFQTTVYMDFTRHNGLSQYSDWTMPLWAHIVQKKKMSSLQAFRALVLSMTPYYVTYKQMD